MKDKVLCVEDDPTLQTLVEASLKDFQVISVKTLRDAESEIDKHQFSAMILDIFLPDGDGLRFLTQISKFENLQNTPILIMSDRSEISNKVMAFSFGADDFISKPFDPIELNARVTAKIRKRNIEVDKNQKRSIGDVLIDLDRQKAFQTEGQEEKNLDLTGIELKILNLLTRRMEQVYTREQILSHVWGQTYITDRTVDSHIAHLRQKLSGTSLVIETVKSIGYRANKK